MCSDNFVKKVWGKNLEQLCHNKRFLKQQRSSSSIKNASQHWINPQHLPMRSLRKTPSRAFWASHAIAIKYIMSPRCLKYKSGYVWNIRTTDQPMEGALADPKSGSNLKVNNVLNRPWHALSWNILMHSGPYCVAYSVWNRTHSLHKGPYFDEQLMNLL